MYAEFSVIIKKDRAEWHFVKNLSEDRVPAVTMFASKMDSILNGSQNNEFGCCQGHHAFDAECEFAGFSGVEECRGEKGGKPYMVMDTSITEYPSYYSVMDGDEVKIIPLTIDMEK